MTALAVASVAPVAADPDPAEADTGIEFELVSVATDGTVVGSAGASRVDISDDGRFVLMTSQATNLVPNDTLNNRDLFLRDREAGTTVRLNETLDGDEVAESVFSDGAAISGDGSVVVFSTGADLTGEGPGAHLYDVATGEVSLIEDLAVAEFALTSVPLDFSLSFDGRFVAFASGDDGFVAGDNNDEIDVFLWDRDSGEVSLVSRSTDGEIGDGTSTSPYISADGRRVVFSTFSTNFGFSDRDEGYTAYLHDVATGRTFPVSRSCAPLGCDTVRAAGAVLSADGTKVLWSPSPSGRTVWLTDVETDEVQVVARSADLGDGDLFGSRISTDGRFVALNYRAGILARTYRLDRLTGEVLLISRAPNGEPSSVSATGEMTPSGATFVMSSAPGNIFETLPPVRVVYVATVVEGERCNGLVATIAGAGAISGTAADDVIIGSDGPDMIDGLAGNDVICAGTGDDIVWGGAGDDVLFGEGGDDTIHGWSGNDTLLGGDGNDHLTGGTDADVLDGGPGADIHIGGTGDDVMLESFGDDIYRGGPGVDTVDYSTAIGPVSARIDGQPGSGRQAESDTINASIENITGSTFDDLLVGSVGPNRLDGGEGDDVIRGRAGDDTLIGGPGNDIIQGDSGNDLIDAGRGNDRLIGGPGPDTLQAGPGTDYCRGSAGPDTYFNCETADP